MLSHSRQLKVKPAVLSPSSIVRQFHSNHEPISYRFRDKRRFQC